MSDRLLLRVRAALAQSEFLETTASIRADGGLALALGRASLRGLAAGEVAQLEAQGNMAEDWSRVRVAEGFDPRRVVGSRFFGDVVLGRFAGRVPVCAGLQLPAGVYDSTVANAVIGHDAVVSSVKLLANYVVAEEALLLDCGRVFCTATTTFGIGSAPHIALEGGGRDVPIYAEIDVEVAAAVAGPRRQEVLPEYRTLVAAYRERAAASRGVIGRRATLQSTPTIRDSYVGPFAQVDGAALVADSTLLSSEEQPVRVASGACVSGSVLQWGSRVDTLAVAERAVIGEHALVERHGKVTDSIVGPGTVLGAGEVTSCLLGPLVGCHHQSLLISTYWPAGRGNVAYGANIGSNHTSRAPDQEFRPGEGMFFGLGVNVKFPADFSQSPYTVVACGLTLLPQRVAFPFSLLMEPSALRPGIAPAYNEIVPAWMLSENMYALRRIEAKHQARNRARRTRFDFRVFRRDTVDLMRDACQRLETVREVKDLYTEREIVGLGKNVLHEDHRRRAIEAYRFHIRYYALLGLLAQVRAVLAEGGAISDGLLHATRADHPEWEHQRRLLAEDLGLPTVKAGLRQLSEMLEKVARDVEQSRARDDARGRRIIDDYAEVHSPAADDDCVRRTWEEVQRLQAEAAGALAALPDVGPAAAWLAAPAAPLPRPAESSGEGQARFF
jgi:hypothetical protein